MTRTFRLGTRRSALALWQANWVSDQLRHHGYDVQIVEMTTRGDTDSASLQLMGGQGVFTKAIQQALLDNLVDIAVHSLKDLPTEKVPGLELAAVPPREDCGDVLVTPQPQTLDSLPAGAVIGTGSTRRQAQIKNYRRDLEVADIRGNVDTRLAKLMSGDYDAIILAEAGLKRLGIDEPAQSAIPKQIMLPAVGQGALGIEIRAEDTETRQCVSCLDDANSHASVLAERTLLAALRAGCLAPVAAWGRHERDELRLEAKVLSADGSQRLDVDVRSQSSTAGELGQQAAEQLYERGAEQLLRRPD